jgi:anti-anti-sigma factor
VSSFELEHLESEDSDITFIGLGGELDLTNATELDERLAAALEGQRLVLDLNRVTFIDSAALHCLFRIARRRGRDGLAFVVETSAPIATTLAIVELDRAAPVAATFETARAALEQARPA